MPRIKINTFDVINSTPQANSAQSIVSGVASGITSTRWRTDGRILGRNGIDARLGSIQNQVAQIEKDICKIYQTAEGGATYYQATEEWILGLRRTFENVILQYEHTNRNENSSKFEVSKRAKIKENFIDTLTDEQVKKINNAINKNDIETVLKTLGITDLTNEGKKVVENSWNNFISSLRGNLKDEVRDEMLTNIFEASGATLNSFASFVNTATAIAKGPESASSFVVLNPNVADTTGVLAQYGSTLGKVATGCKIGLPILGGILDFASMRKEGTNLQDATVKAVAHVGIGIVGGEIGAKIGAGIGSLLAPGVGTVIGAAAGFVLGVVITTAGNAIFDAVYDNKDEIKEYYSNVKENVEEKIPPNILQIGNRGECAVGLALGCIW